MTGTRAPSATPRRKSPVFMARSSPQRETEATRPFRLLQPVVSTLIYRCSPNQKVAESGPRPSHPAGTHRGSRWSTSPLSMRHRHENVGRSTRSVPQLSRSSDRARPHANAQASAFRPGSLATLAGPALYLFQLGTRNLRFDGENIRAHALENVLRLDAAVSPMDYHDTIA
jgi:hypothetical protein